MNDRAGDRQDGGAAGGASGGVGPQAVFARAAEIFLEVKGLAAEERRIRLAERCAGDVTLLAMVEKLLAGNSEAEAAAPTFDRLGEQLHRAAAEAAVGAGFDGPPGTSGGVTAADERGVGAGGRAGVGIGVGAGIGGGLGGQAGGAGKTGGGSEAGGDESSGVEPPLAEPTRIGKYVLLQKIGEGGFGVVYAAEQREPIRRRVAMKIVKPGMGSKEVIARFEAERQALALLDHPNVAKVFEAGALADGRPYFVMEHVPGVPITDYCDLARLTTRQRLDLFVQVCQAVQHAHQKGIIHRDIKPSNVLVTMFDGKPVPKVIDFGIAKAIHQPLTSGTLYTEVGRLMGTPEYMSPEQASSGGVDVDTRTDVYSLGVLLFQLLTGTLPFEPRALRKAGYDGIIKMISQLEPPRPSARFSTLWSRDVQTLRGEGKKSGAAKRPASRATGRGQAQAAGGTAGRSAAGGDGSQAEQAGGQVPVSAAEQIAAAHGTDPSSLLRQLRGDLDWIVLRAMEKSRLKRYDSVRELVMDIERSLRHEPITARPPSTLYRVGRFARRNRVVLGAGAAVALGLATGVLGIAIALIGATRQNAELELSVREAQAQRARAVEAEQAMGVALKKLAEASEDLRASRDTALAKSTEAERLLYINQLARSGEAMEQGNSALAGKILAEAPRSMRGWEWAWLVQRCEGGQTLLRHPEESHTTNASWSRDGRRVVTTHEDGATIVWDAQLGVAKLTIRDQFTAVQRAVFSPDGSRVVTVGFGGLATVWDSTTGKPVLKLPGHDGDVWWVEYSPDGSKIVTGDESGAVRVFDAATAKPLGMVKAHSRRVWSASYSPDGAHLTTSSFDGSVAVYNSATLSELKRRSFGEAWPWTARYSPNGQLLVIGQYDGSLGIYDAKSLQPVRMLSRHLGEVFRAEFSPDGLRVVSGADDGRIQLHDVKTGGLLSTLSLHQGKVRSVAFGPDGGSILSASGDGTAMVWRDTAGRGMTLINDAAENHNASCFTPDGKQLLVGSSATGLQVYDVAAARLLRYVRPGFDACAVGVSPNGGIIAMGWNSRLALIDAASGQVIRELACPSAWPLCLSFSPDGLLLAASFDHAAEGMAEGGRANRTGALKVYSTRTGEVLFADAPNDEGVTSAKFSPDGRVLAATDQTGGVWLYTVPFPPSATPSAWPRSARLRQVVATKGQATRLRFLSNTSFVVVDVGGRIESWSFGPGGESPVLGEATQMAQATKASAAEISPDGSRLAVISGPRMLIFDLRSGNQLTSVALPFGDGLGLCFDPSGRSIAAVSPGGAVALMEVDSRLSGPSRAARRSALRWLDEAQEANPGQSVAGLLERATLAPEVREMIKSYAPYRDDAWWLWALIERKLGPSPASWMARAEACVPLAQRARELAPGDQRLEARRALLLALANSPAEAVKAAEAGIALAKAQHRPPLPGFFVAMAAAALAKGDLTLAGEHTNTARAALANWPMPDEQRDLFDRFVEVAKAKGVDVLGAAAGPDGKAQPLAEQLPAGAR